VITRTGIRAMFRRPRFIALLIVSYLPFFVPRAVQIWAAAYFPQAAFLTPTPQTFRGFLLWQQIFVFFIAVYAGAGLVANDRRANALQVYLSKPLTRVDYIFGKLAILMTFLLLITWIPAVVLLLMQALVSGSLAFLGDHPRILPAVTLFSFVLTLTAASAMLAFSSLSKNSRYVAVMYAGVVFFTPAIYTVLYAFTRDGRLAWMAVPFDLAQIADAIFGVPLGFEMPLASAVLVVVAIIAAAGLVLERRVRAVEIVT
jgi:ABC-2 type transport system permease protein